jgi:hypothetical protein
LSPAKVITWSPLPTSVWTEWLHDWRGNHRNASEMWRARLMGLICISFSRVIVSAVVNMRDIVLQKYCVWITTQRLANVKIYRESPQSFQMIFEQNLKCNQPSFSFICLQTRDSLSFADRKSHSSSRSNTGIDRALPLFPLHQRQACFHAIKLERGITDRKKRLIKIYRRR